MYVITVHFGSRLLTARQAVNCQSVVDLWCLIIEAPVVNLELERNLSQLKDHSGREHWSFEPDS